MTKHKQIHLIDYSSFCATDYLLFFKNIAHEITHSYHIEINVGTLEENRTGEFNGKVINIDIDQTEEEKLFLLLHLFGHIVQWSVSPYYRELGLKQPGFTEFESYRQELLKQIEEIYTYEEEASAYGLQLLHHCGIHELDQWLSDWFHADWKFLKRVYENGFRKEFTENFKAQYFIKNSPMILAKEIPVFVSEEWEYRFAF